MYELLQPFHLFWSNNTYTYYLNPEHYGCVQCVHSTDITLTYACANKTCTLSSVQHDQCSL
jgi:hypothetical protein